jgi:hypothetical protein
MVELLFPRTLSEDIKDVFILPRGLGLRGVYKGSRNVTFLNPLTYLVYYGFHHSSIPLRVLCDDSRRPVNYTRTPRKGQGAEFLYG